jgi:hypothetical protein
MDENELKGEESSDLPPPGEEIPKPIFKNGFCNFSRKKGFSTLCHYEGPLYAFDANNFERFHICLPCYKKAITEGVELPTGRPDDFYGKLKNPIIKPGAEYKDIKEAERVQVVKHRENNFIKFAKIGPRIKETGSEVGLENNPWVIPDEPDPVPAPEPVKEIEPEPEILPDLPNENIIESIEGKEVMGAVFQDDKYTDEQVKFLTENRNRIPFNPVVDEFKEKFGIEKSKAALQNKVFFIKKKLKKMGNKESYQGRHSYSVDQERFILENFVKAGASLCSKLFEEKYNVKISPDTLGHKFRKLKYKPGTDNKNPEPPKEPIQAQLDKIIAERVKQVPEIKISEPKELLDNGSIAVDIASQVYSPPLPVIPPAINLVEPPKSKLPIKIQFAELWQEVNKLLVSDKAKFEVRIALHHCIKIIENPDPDEKDLIIQNSYFSI